MTIRCMAYTHRHRAVAVQSFGRRISETRQNPKILNARTRTPSKCVRADGPIARAGDSGAVATHAISIGVSTSRENADVRDHRLRNGATGNQGRDGNTRRPENSSEMDRNMCALKNSCRTDMTLPSLSSQCLAARRQPPDRLVPCANENRNSNSNNTSI